MYIVLTIAVVTILEFNGNRKRIYYMVPSLEGDPPTRLEDTADKEEFEPILGSDEREEDGGEGRN